MEELGAFEPAKTEWAAPKVIAPKKSGSLRFWVDYKLNAVVVRYFYLIPRINECIDSLGDALFFSILDANRNYGQAEIDNADHGTTGFTFNHGFFRF